MKKRWPYVSLMLGLVCMVLYLGTPFPPRIHDPSTIIRCKDEYWCYSTGLGVNSWHSRDLIHWKRGPRVFEKLPEWTERVAPDQRGYFWAPDVIRVGDRYLLYYVVSKWASRTSAIGLATSPTLDPSDSTYHWTDRGIVVRSSNEDRYNAIDPDPMIDADGRMWMAFGSFWTGIKLVELDPGTGLRKSGAPLYPLAWAKEIEAPYLIRHEGSYYLFVNWGLCCRGVESTYEIRVGRSRAIMGPYLDRNGVDMLHGGGTLFLGTEGRHIGPGQLGLLGDGANEWISYHYYDGEHQGQASLGLRRLGWSSDGWPVAGEYASALLR